MKKECTKCHETKNSTKFPWKSAKHRRRRTICQMCVNQQACIANANHWRHEFKKRDPIGFQRQRRNAELKRKFGITLEQYRAIWKTQYGVCAICGRPERSKTQGKPRALCVDHDHEIGEIRGLLCRDCNRSLGGFGDDVKRLEKAIAYLQYHQR